MKRVKAACILQTLVFMQKEDCGLSKNSIIETNRREFDHYKQTMEKTRTRYQIISQEEQKMVLSLFVFVNSTTARRMSANTSCNQCSRPCWAAVSY